MRSYLDIELSTTIAEKAKKTQAKERQKKTVGFFW
jgi:hypothetical protein